MSRLPVFEKLFVRAAASGAHQHKHADDLPFGISWPCLPAAAEQGQSGAAVCTSVVWRPHGSSVEASTVQNAEAIPNQQGLASGIASSAVEAMSAALHHGASFLSCLASTHRLQPMPAALSSWQPCLNTGPDAGFRSEPMHSSSFRGDTSGRLRACNLAAEHPDILAAIKRELEKRGVILPSGHFANPDVELIRYAITVGLLTASTPAEKERVVEAAATRAQQTAEWLSSHTFMPESELEDWMDVVHWAEDDSDGHPVLVVHLEAVLKQDRVAAERGAEAILAHMEAALASRLSDAPGCPEQLVVVLDSRGAPTIQFRRLVRAIQNIALTLNRHYPARLHRLYLVDAPAIVHLPVRAIKTLLHPSTSSKIIICERGDPRVPLDLDFDASDPVHQAGRKPAFNE